MKKIELIASGAGPPYSAMTSSTASNQSETNILYRPVKTAHVEGFSLYLSLIMELLCALYYS